MARTFNTTGRCIPDIHYMVNLDARLDEIEALIKQGAFFSINKGRQYGKTTMLHALNNHLQSDYIVISLDFQTLSTSSFTSEYSFVSDFSSRLIRMLRGISGLDSKILDEIKFSSENLNINLVKLFDYLSDLCETAEKPVVLLIDEVDRASDNQIFLDFLSQLRGYYLNRKVLPIFQSVVLAGVYNIRNLKRKIRPDSEHKVNSPWNIATKFKVNMDFTKVDIENMLWEYERDYHIGMDIDKIARMIYEYTSGYPVLVSSLCKIMDEELKGNEKFKEGSAVWSKEGVLEAVSRLLLESNDLFDSLIGQLDKYPEINEVLYSMLFNGVSINYNPDNAVINLSVMFGFVKNNNGIVMVANRIFETRLYNNFLYHDEMKSVLSHAAQKDKYHFVSDGILDMDLIMKRFSVEFNNLYHGRDDKFIEENCRKFFLLFLKPIINGTGSYYVEARTRDNKRTDIIVNYRGVEQIIECKIWHGNEYSKRGEQQLADYLDIYGVKKGWLLSFNFNKNKIPGMREIQCGDKTLVEVVV